MTTLIISNSVNNFQFQFPLVVCFYTMVEVKWLPIIDSKLSSVMIVWLCVFAIQIDSERKLMIIVNRSIEHPQIPTTKQYVRVETYSSEMVIRPHSSFDEVLYTC